MIKWYNLLKNIGFRNKFINRFADELNTRFIPQNVKNKIDSLFELVKPEIDAHYTRWDSNPSKAQNNVNDLKTFADRRHSITKNNIKAEFDLPDYHQITIQNTDSSQGFVSINNNLKIEQNNWKGDYYETVPITLKAVAKEGYQFSHWSGASTSTQEIISLNLVRNTTIKANFVVSVINNIVINEINFNSGNEFNTGDWVELYNPNNSEIDVSKWILKDDDDTHAFIFPEGVTIGSKSFLIIVRDEKGFKTVFPEVTNYIGEIDFGFGGIDAVRLYDENKVLQDQVNYASDGSWPVCTDDNGPSLELISPDLENNISQSWDCTNVKGTPNKENSLPLNTNQIITQEFKMYPNPINRNRSLFITGNDINKVEIYSVLGKKVLDESFNNKNRLELKLYNFSSGIYFVKINNSKRTKLIVNW